MIRDLGSVRKILIVTLSNLGDAVLTLPVFRSVSERFPGASVHVVVGESSRVVFENEPGIQKIILYDRRIPWARKLSFLLGIRGESYDLILDLRHSFVGLLGGARSRNRYFYFHRRPRHKALRHLEALEGLFEPVPPKQFFSSEGKEARPVVVAAVGSKSDIKKWPAGYFAKLLDRLALEKGCRTILVGDKNDSMDCAQVLKAMRAPATDLSGKTSFKELCSILKSASLVVTNDSAPLHIADAFHTPTLALFGPTDPGKYGPRRGESLVARRELFCSPCERPQCRFGHECMKELGVDEVYFKALQILNHELRPKKLKILIIRLDRIGDAVLSLPAIEAVRSHFPDAWISVMVRPGVREIMEGHPSIDEVIPYFYENKGRHSSLFGNLRFLKETRRRRFDICFILHPSVRSHCVPFVAGIPYRIGFGSALGFLLTQSVRDLRHLGLKHESEYALDIVRVLGAEASGGESRGVTFFTEHLRKTERLSGQKIVAVHPGSSCASKRWPIGRYAELVQMILRNTPFHVAVIGGKDEKLLGEFLKKQNAARVEDLTGELDLKELAAFFSRCELLISNDSGPVHIASSVGAKTLVIFGRNKAGLNRERWRPLGNTHRAIQKNVGCVTCLADACTIDFECLKAVSVEEVYKLFAEMTAPRESFVKTH